MADRTADLPPDRLADLLGVGREAEDLDSPAAALAALLDAPASPDPASPASPSAVLGRPCHELRAYAGKSIGELLTAPDTDLAALTALKDYAKELVRRARLDSQRAAATALYYAAIAAALVGHGRRITSHDMGKLAEGLADLLARPWFPPELVGMMARARAAAERG